MQQDGEQIDAKRPAKADKPPVSFAGNNSMNPGERGMNNVHQGEAAGLVNSFHSVQGLRPARTRKRRGRRIHGNGEEQEIQDKEPHDMRHKSSLNAATCLWGCCKLILLHGGYEETPDIARSGDGKREF